MANIFLSYATEDRERVAPLVSRLVSEGFSVWWDRRIGIGSSFDREIERELNDAECVVTVWSEASVNSDWVRVESQEGMDRGILVPVCIDNVKPPLAFRRVQAANLVESDTHAIEAFLRAVGSTVDTPPTTKTPPQTSIQPPKAPNSRVGFIAAACLVVALLSAGGWWWSSQHDVAVPVATRMVTPLRAVLVMPFENQGSKLDAGAVGAMHSDVISLMARDGYLNMIGRSTARRLKSSGASLTAIASETDASHVVEVALRPAGSDTRISMNLIRTDTKSSVWSFSFNEPLDGSVQSLDYLARKIAGRLWSQIKTWQRLTKQTVDAQAYELVALGLDMSVYGPELIKVYEQALQIQPDFYDALDDLSLAYCRVPPPHGGSEKCLSTAQKLIELRPNDPRSYELLGDRLMSPALDRWDDAVVQFKKAEAMDDDFISLWYAAGLMGHGHAERAVAKLRKYAEQSPLDAGILAPALLATNRPAEARDLGILHNFTLGEPFYSDPWEVPLSYVFENDYPSAIQALRDCYDLLGDSGEKNQSPTGYVLLSRLFRDLGDLQSADYWLARAATRFGNNASAVLNEHFTLGILNRDLAAVEKSSQLFLELYDVDTSEWVGLIRALNANDEETLRKKSSDNSMRAAIPFKDIPSTLLSAIMVGDDDHAATVARRIDSYYKDGGGSWGLGGNPDPFTMPGERRKQFNLAIISLIENNWDSAMAHFEQGFQVGARSQWRLPFYDLIADQQQIYNGFVDTAQWQAFLAKVKRKNEEDLQSIGTRFPELVVTP